MRHTLPEYGTGAYPLSLLTSDLFQQCKFLSPCKERGGDGFKNMLCINSSSKCSCQNRTCWRIEGSCLHACNESHIVTCIKCLQTARCMLCSAQCAGVCVDPYCEYAGNKTACPACVPGYYGHVCNESCSEVCKGSCFEETGFCENCTGNRYGRECELSCSAMCHSCSLRNGSCLKCLDGYIGRECSSACPNGLFGAGCVTKCHINCYDNGCDHRTGYCSGGCRPGYFGRSCLKKCPDGKYGTGCIAECPVTCASSNTCHHINGSCLQGCSEGFHGDYCDVLCSMGKYGENCQRNCSQNCFFGICNRFSGHCHTCVQGRAGIFCDDVIGVQSMSGYIDDESVSTDETILIFLALFSAGAGTWVLLGVCVYYKQKIIRDKILKTGRLPRRWRSVINRHPQYFIYSGLRRRSSFLWRTTPREKWEMGRKYQRRRDVRSFEGFPGKVRQMDIKAKTADMRKKHFVDIVEMVMPREQRVNEITTDGNNAIKTSTDQHETPGKNETNGKEEIIKDRMIGCNILTEMKDKDRENSSDFNVKRNVVSKENIKIYINEKYSDEVEHSEKECTEVKKTSTELAMNDCKNTFTDNVVSENKDMAQITLDSVEETARSVVINLTMLSDRSMVERNLAELTNGQQISNSAENKEKEYRDAENEEMKFPNTADTKTKCENTGNEENIFPNAARRDRSINGIVSVNNRPQDISDSENKTPNVSLVVKSSKKAHAENILDKVSVENKLTNLEQADPNYLNTQLKDTLSTMTEQDKTWSSDRELSKSAYKNTMSTGCTNSSKQCICSIQQRQGSTITMASEQGDSFLQVHEIGDLYQTSDNLADRHKRQKVPFKDGTFRGRSSSRFKMTDEHLRETGRSSTNLLYPTTRSKYLQNQGPSTLKKIHGKQGYSLENVQEVTSATFNTEVESSETGASSSCSSTARTFKRRSGSTTTNEGTHSSRSESTGSMATSSSTASMAGTSSLGLPRERFQLSKDHRRYLQLALERQSQPWLAKTDMVKSYSSFGAQSVLEADMDLEHNSYTARHSPQPNIFQKGYKQIVNAVNKIFKPVKPMPDDFNDDASIQFPHKPSYGQFLIYRLEAWRKYRDAKRGIGVFGRQKENARPIRSSISLDKSRVSRTLESLSGSSSTMTKTQWAIDKTKEENSATGQSDIWISRSASSRAVSASTYSRGTRFSAFTGLSASNSSTSSRNSTSALSISSSGTTTERDDPRTDVDRLSPVTRRTIRYPRPYVHKYSLDISSRSQSYLPYRGYRPINGPAIRRSDMPERHFGGKIQQRHHSSVHK